MFCLPVVLCFSEVIYVFVLQVFLERKLIANLHKRHMEQVTKKYGPTWQEKEKMGTPSMGGVTFPVVMALPIILNCCFFSNDLSSDLLALLVYPILIGLIGFYDDWLKNIRHSSEGLRSLQKLFCQILVTTVTILFAMKSQTPNFFGLEIPEWLYIVILVFLGVGLQNAVNVTDGLDGLAAGLALVSFASLAVILQENCLAFSIALCSIALCLGFLWHNSKPATIFMGDTGAHFLAGLIFSICLVSDRIFLTIPVSFVFGIEIISVALQIFAIRILGRKIFRMSPIHHHFELMGYSETKIVARFYIIHALGIFTLLMLLGSLI